MSQKSASLERHTFNPATGQTQPTRRYLDEAEIERLLTTAVSAQREWGHASFSARATVLREAARLLRHERISLAYTISLEMGKPLTEAEAEIDKSAWNCEFVAENMESWLADEVVTTNAALSYVAHRPLGAVLAILPWNFPVWQIFRCAAATLMAGNGFLLKHAPNVPGCAAKVADLMSRAGAPAGVFQNLDVQVDRVADIIGDKRVSAVAFTGSPAAGAYVAARAGAACKKSILELGGSDAFLVLEDADIEAAVAAAVRGRFANCGQVCLAAKRFIVVSSVWGDFEARFAEAIAALRVGDPLDRATQLGPLARDDLRSALDLQVQKSVRAGARILMGGHALPGNGYYYAPTLLTETDATMPVVTEETFGPVAPLIRARDAEHALHLANESVYGLAAVVWTRDIDRARLLSQRLEVGSVFINGVTASDPRLPVGGVKLSGYGRELGAAGARELVNIQSVWIG
jgi:acyl-CoA reductase-like NAD-dependent aldehyde dehydrogenase